MINPPTYDAEVLASDTTLDIAILKINPHDDETWEVLEWNTSKSIPEGTPKSTLGHGLSSTLYTD